MTPAELKKMTKAELIELAKKKKIKVNTRMLKADLVKAVSAGLKPARGAGPKAGSKAKPRAAGSAKAKAGRKPAAKRSAGGTAKKAAASGAKAKAKSRAGKAGGRKASARAKGAAAKKTARKAAQADERTIRQKAVAGKYHLTTGPMQLPPVDSMEIPAGYGADRVTMMVRDPWWLFAYWEVTESSWRRLEKKHSKDWDRCRFVLRVFDRTGRGGSFFDVDTGYGPRSWYVNVSPGRAYQAAIGIIGPGGAFEQIAISNTMETPRDTVSEKVDERWVVPDEIFERIFAASGGYASVSGSGSQELGEKLGRRLMEEMGSGALASMGSAGAPRGERGRGFWLWVATELILYGATEPDAAVKIRDEEIKLRGDGTFSARFALPDGKIEIPVEAVSGDGVELRRIDTEVKKASRAEKPKTR